MKDLSWVTPLLKGDERVGHAHANWVYVVSAAREAEPWKPGEGSRRGRTIYHPYACSVRVQTQWSSNRCENRGKVERSEDELGRPTTAAWYCGVHDPVPRGERRAAQHAKWQAQMDAARARWQAEAATPRVVEAARGLHAAFPMGGAAFEDAYLELHEALEVLDMAAERES